METYKVIPQLEGTAENLTKQIAIEQGYYNSLYKLMQEQLLPKVNIGEGSKAVEEYLTTVEVMRKKLLEIVELTQKREYIIQLIHMKGKETHA